MGGQEWALGGLWTCVMEALQQLDARDREVRGEHRLFVMELGPSLSMEYGGGGGWGGWGVQILRLSFGLLGAKPMLPQEVCMGRFKGQRCGRGMDDDDDYSFCYLMGQWRGRSWSI